MSDIWTKLLDYDMLWDVDVKEKCIVLVCDIRIK